MNTGSLHDHIVDVIIVQNMFKWWQTLAKNNISRLSISIYLTVFAVQRWFNQVFNSSTSSP